MHNFLSLFLCDLSAHLATRYSCVINTVLRWRLLLQLIKRAEVEFRIANKQLVMICIGTTTTLHFRYGNTNSAIS